jgi:hypothetical protein
MEPIEQKNNAVSVSIRPLALPAEHGGWGIVLEPIALALLIAPSVAGVSMGVAAVAAFLARHPLRLAARDRLHHRRLGRTAVCEQLALAYSAIAVAALVGAVALSSARILLPFAIAAPLGLLQFGFDVRNRGRAVIPEMAGIVAAGATAAAIALAGGRTISVAATLWILAMLRAIPALLFVRAVLGRESRSIAIAVHVVAVAAAFALWQRHLAPLAAIAAMLLLLGRAIAGMNQNMPARSVGIRELVWGATTVLLIAGGW